MLNTLPSNFGNTIAPFAPIGRQPVGQENSDLRTSSFKPTEQLAETARSENRRLPEERPNQDAERDRLAQSGGELVEGDSRLAAASVSTADSAQVPVKTAQSEKAEREQAERARIQELAARDREVRAHEQAHAAAAGQYGGNPTYEFVRGPDGVSYAVGGSVNVDTSPIPGDPEATLRKAEQLQRAASAPADPSGQDRQVAASAARMAERAREELRQQRAQQSDTATQPQDELEAQKKAEEEKAQRESDRLAAEEERANQSQSAFEDEQRLLDQRRARAEVIDQASRRNIDINRRLIEIGVVSGARVSGAILNQRV